MMHNKECYSNYVIQFIEPFSQSCLNKRRTKKKISAVCRLDSLNFYLCDYSPPGGPPKVEIFGLLSPFGLRPT